MNIVGAILFFIVGAGVMILLPKVFNQNKGKDYTNYPVTTAKVLHTEDFAGDKWTVEFQTPDGRNTLGMDDIIAGSTFFPKKYHIPKPGTEEKVYYWKYEGNSSFSINGMQVEYEIHFCDESLYEVSEKSVHGMKLGARIIGAIIMVMSVAILCFGYR